MKKILTLIALAGIVTFTACKTDVNPTFDSPSITVPTGVQVQAETDGIVTFTVKAPGKIASATATASSGSVSIADQKVGETETTIDVTYTAPATAGNQTITLTVTDAQSPSKTTDAIATVEVTTTPPPPANEVVSGSLTQNTTWTADRIWELASKVIIGDGVTLTIEPGTIIKGREGEGSLATGVVIARGGKIMAEGTADKPIIFTSILDNIEVGQKMGTNLTKDDISDWGGLIILGKAPTSVKDGDTEGQIEGIPADEAYGAYGGNDPHDNSGVLKYVSVRHGGALIGEGNEINGITLGAVGDGTTIDHVEVYATFDDGIEFFGGTVNLTNILISYQGDDGLDIDQNYAGTITNFLVEHGNTANTDEGLEIDGPENSTHKDGLFTLKNGTVMRLAGSSNGTPTDLKSKAQGTIDNVIFTGYPSGSDVLKIAASFDAGNACADKEDAYTHWVASPATLKVVDSKYNGVKVYDSDTDDACALPGSYQTAADALVVSNNAAAGVDASVFADWTLASLNGTLK